MSYDGRAIANFVLDQCEGKGRELSNLSLQKVVYFCHVWSLIVLERPLIKHSFEAWEFGPVLPYLYREFRAFDRGSIRTRAKRLDPLDGTSRIVEYVFGSDTCDLLSKVVEFYSQVRPSDLIRLSHADGGPWCRVWNHKGVVNPGMRIEDTQIIAFYSKAFQPFTVQ